MQCPSCKSHRLSPVKLDYGLPARSCKSCSGILIDLLTYRDWLERYPEVENLPDRHASQSIQENNSAISCSRCNRPMLRFRISAQTSNHIDYCSSCDDVWLDSGEWELLKQYGFHTSLSTILTDPWQRRIRQESANQAHENRFKGLLGTEDYNRLKDVKLWIENHEYKDDLVRYLLRK